MSRWAGSSSASAAGAADTTACKSIIQEWGSPDFSRVRLGIGRPPAQWDAADYVLADFTEDERRLLPDLIAEAADATETIVKREQAPLVFGEIGQHVVGRVPLGRRPSDAEADTGKIPGFPTPG